MTAASKLGAALAIAAGSAAVLFGWYWFRPAAGPTKQETLTFLRQKLGDYAKISRNLRTVTDVTLGDDGVLAWTTREEAPDWGSKPRGYRNEAVLLVNAKIENRHETTGLYDFSGLYFSCVEDMACLAQCEEERCQRGPWKKPEELYSILFADKLEQDRIFRALNHLIDLLRQEQNWKPKSQLF